MFYKCIAYRNKNLVDSRSNSEYFAECLKEYISHPDEKNFYVSFLYEKSRS